MSTHNNNTYTSAATRKLAENFAELATGGLRELLRRKQVPIDRQVPPFVIRDNLEDVLVTSVAQQLQDMGREVQSIRNPVPLPLAGSAKVQLSAALVMLSAVMLTSCARAAAFGSPALETAVGVWASLLLIGSGLWLAVHRWRYIKRRRCAARMLFQTGAEHALWKRAAELRKAAAMNTLPALEKGARL